MLGQPELVLTGAVLGFDLAGLGQIKPNLKQLALPGLIANRIIGGCAADLRDGRGAPCRDP